MRPRGWEECRFYVLGKVDKITKASQFREVLCKSVPEHISSSNFAEGLCSGKQLCGHFHMKNTHSLLKAREAWRICKALLAFLGLRRLALGWRGMFTTGDFRQRRLP